MSRPLTKDDWVQAWECWIQVCAAIQVYSPPVDIMSKHTELFTLALQKTKLDDLHKTIFQHRFLHVLNTFETRCKYLAVLYHILRIFVTVGSLIVPALLSIQYSDTSSNTSIKDPQSFAYEIYWATWVISLLVTTSNGIVSVFKIDKKYFFLHTTMEQLRSEGWQYLELSGRYSGFYSPGLPPSHENQFVYFCHAVEKIKMHQVEEEYFKLTESNAHPTQTTLKAEGKSESATNPLVHPTPQASLEEIAKSLPPELLRQLKSVVTVDGEGDTNAQKKGGSHASVPVSTELPSASSPEKRLLRSASTTEMSESLSA